ncbi:MAG: DUF2510 domain-containing protein [Micrococcales bacterium]|nr:DUF2510 domain-containing protein [Micrococcales bacterium]OJX69584.1 MAG: hypothetical protein BGO94_13910 [Micrococcales bacterium 72-143]
MESSTAPAAGWFPDPGDPSTERWWSGHEWTEHTRRPLGAEVPEAFTPHVATLVAERPAAEPEPFVFAMTPTAETASAAETTAAAPVAAIQPEASPAVELGLAQPAERSWFTTDEPLAPEVSTLLTGAPLTPPWLTPAPELADPAPLAAAPEPAAPEPIAPGFIASAPAETATATPQPVFAMTPSFAGTAPSTPEPMLTDAATLAPVPALTTPAPVAAPTAPEFVAPAASALAPAPDAAEGFVLPGAPVGPVTAADLEPRVGRHADAMPEPAPVPAPALPAVRPVGFTASADPEVANRYRSVIHAADQEALAAPAAAPAPGNMPSSTMMSARSTVSAPSYASYDSASNRAARAALTSGIIGLVASGLVVGSRLVDIGIPGAAIGLATLVLVPLAFITGLVAIITGIVGLVVARRARTGRGAALGGLLLGILLVVVLPAAFVGLMLLFAQAFGVFA